MDSEKTFLQVIKCGVAIACVCGVIIRRNIVSGFVNYYMAVVNIASFFVAINLWMYDCYSKLHKICNEENNNVIKKAKLERIVMVSYILIFMLNIIAAVGIYHLYKSSVNDLAVLNDGLGILSLGFAISTDFLSNFLINIIINFV